MANYQCCQIYPRGVVTHGVATYSDHSPVWLDTDGEREVAREKIPFWFEAMWVWEMKHRS